jgi:hypothetical protein
MTNNTDTQTKSFRAYEVTRKDGTTYLTPFLHDALPTGLPYARKDMTQNDYLQHFDI